MASAPVRQLSLLKKDSCTTITTGACIVGACAASRQEQHAFSKLCSKLQKKVPKTTVCSTDLKADLS